jgi:radical SAM superfamily enzyme YgiQ (UPF0313 family)
MIIDKKKKVTIFELVTYDRVTPLLSGYLQAYAEKDDRIRSTYTFKSVSVNVRKPPSQFHDLLKEADSDVYAFSCYCWNMKLVMSLVQSLWSHKPEAHIVLGGPQVASSGHKYLSKQNERTVVCNGEGISSFARYLEEVTNSHPDLEKVNNISFYREQQYITTDECIEIEDLNTIPSPYLNGYFDQEEYDLALVETNRGCPFSCAYCHWGNNSKIKKFDINRVKEEFEWISKKGIPYWFIVDANWGIYKRDVELSEFVVECKKKYGKPDVLGWNGAKNQWDRGVEIGKILFEGGMQGAVTFSLQSLNPDTLNAVKRINLPLEKYAELQDTANANKLQTSVELIWPLPKETLTSFFNAIDTLCYHQANIVCYDLVLLNNTELERKKDEYGFVTIEGDDDISEEIMVIQTNEVSTSDRQKGTMVLMALMALYTFRKLYCTARYLHVNRSIRYTELYQAFVEYCLNKGGEAVVWYFATALPFDEKKEGILHDKEFVWDQIIRTFVMSQGWWNDIAARHSYEIDLVNTLSMSRYGESALERYNFELIKVVGFANGDPIVQIKEEYFGMIVDTINCSGRKGDQGNAGDTFRLCKQDHIACQDDDSDVAADFHRHLSISMPVWEIFDKSDLTQDQSNISLYNKASA